MALRLGAHLDSLTDRLRWEPVTRRVRARLDGRPVLDTTDAVLVWEPRRVVPMYAVPPADLSATLAPRARAAVPDDLPPELGPVHFEWHHTPGTSFDVVVGERTLAHAAFAPDDPDLGGRVVIEWDPFDWTEEAQAVTGHPHDPFKRIDLLATERHVVVSLGGVVLADTHRALALYETHLPPRWYVPHDDVVTDLLVGSPTTSTCAYKGHAAYVSLRPGAVPGLDEEAGHDVAWTYPHPLHEVEAVRGMFCFWAERTDLEVDGVAVPRPATPWSAGLEPA
ncbi:DUF427 domain-containing protein [Phycicoccus sp. HDW14]|uniref:DUF427 domain-containing protein n=1 Tax=Phycicoccus sp. HDW14 TaxID=2714941 RepID=UPI00140853DB|nr:DUF427 domain-containing protein [Phycicoccus sp. HDW14]QIM21362.1 DUF427 domain-containing protein [Phycicoccus sp. HDW14]